MFYWSQPDVPFDQGTPPWVGPLNLPIWPSSWSPPSCLRSVNPLSSNAARPQTTPSWGIMTLFLFQSHWKYKKQLRLDSIYACCSGQVRHKKGYMWYPSHFSRPLFFPESVGGALWMQSCPVAPADLAACGSNQNYPLIDYLLGSRKAIMDLILNLLKVFKACFWVLLRRADSNVLQGGVT